MKNRILILIKGLNRGGAETLLVTRARYLNIARFDYQFAYLLPNANALVRPLEDAGFPAVCLDGAGGPAWIYRLKELVRERAIDALHIHSPVAAVGARLAFPKGGVGPRFVYTEHSVWKGYHPMTRWSNAVTFWRNDHVFAVSEHVRASIRYPRALRFLRMPPVETLYQGIDVESIVRTASPGGVRRELGIPEDVPVVGSVANLVPQKGHRHLLRAMVYVRREFPEARLVLVGTGPLERRMKELTRELGLQDVVVFTGSRPDARRVASSFDVFMLASIQEGLSIALLEAMALKKPVVVTGVGGLPEVVRHGEHGFVVGPASPQAMSAALCTLLRDPALRKRMGEAAGVRAADFRIEQTVVRAEEVYEELLS